MEEPLHEPALLQEVAHEDEQGHRDEDLLLHESDGLEHDQVEDHVAERQVAEPDGEEHQREDDGESGEDRDEEDAEQDEAEHLVAHRARPRIARPHRISSERPWSSRRAAVSGMTALNGYIGHGTVPILSDVRSPISQANHVSTAPA